MLSIDKIKHIIAGLIAFAFFVIAIQPAAEYFDYPLSFGWGIVFAAFVGWAKERLYDWYRKPEHTVDKADAWFTAGGGVAGWGIYKLITGLL